MKPYTHFRSTSEITHEIKRLDAEVLIETNEYRKKRKLKRVRRFKKWFIRREREEIQEVTGKAPVGKSKKISKV